MKPEELKYTKEHEWIAPDGTVGISDYAQKELGDVVFAELPKAGKVVEAGQELCVLESVKAVSSVNSPVSGKVAEVNSALSANPELVNQDPLGKGWIAKLEIKDILQVSKLFDLASYRKYIDELHPKH
ncbi:MAG: glycine cleavage system protein GcvH [Candidatus Margulisiibacteriota bacterium]